MASGLTPDLRARRVAEETARNRYRRPSLYGRFQGLPWWMTLGMNRLSPGMVVVVMLIGLVAVGLVGVRYYFGGSSDQDDLRLVAEDSVPYDGDMDSNFGRQIPPLQRLRWARFGLPLHIGPRGLPLIQNVETGDVREMTDLEMEFPHDVSYERDPVDDSIVFVPGPTGYAVRWWEPDEYSDLPAARAFDRIGWFVYHEDMLNDASRDVYIGLQHVVGSDYSVWNYRWGKELVAIADALNDEYAFGDSRNWDLIGALRYCNDGLDSGYRSGVSEGCPSTGYQAVVGSMWRNLGEMVVLMELIGKSAGLQSDRHVGHLYYDVEVGEYHEKQIVKLRDVILRLKSSADLLKVYGEAEGYYVQVNLP